MFSYMVMVVPIVIIHLVANKVANRVANRFRCLAINELKSHAFPRGM